MVLLRLQWKRAVLYLDDVILFLLECVPGTRKSTGAVLMSERCKSATEAKDV